MDTINYKYTNQLIHETSPYLLQHAHNPVDWYPWGDKAFDKAKRENKLVLVSIGYSSCHWCHVMAHESFEDEETAKYMNEYFVCIKVDREERPDVDQIYMTAVQVMTGSGGWPLNCFTLPDGKPVYGGTYFPNLAWKEVLQKLAAFYKEQPDRAIQYAEELTQGIKKAEIISINKATPAFTVEDAKSVCDSMKKMFDTTEGGYLRAPKFPLPNNYLFLLHYYHLTNDENVLKQVKLTLHKMAYGGIYDQLGGGFARYSTDAYWKAPHFEKMLYDNAQLVSLYSEAYQLTKEPLYKQVVYETLEFIKREMSSPEGSFYSALDADSEGEEGKYYVWKKPVLEQLLGKKFSLFRDYFNVNDVGLWEHENYILLRKKSDEELAKSHGTSVEQLQKEIRDAKSMLMKERAKRIRPALDDKQLTSWNALMMKAYIDAYNSFGEKTFLQTAIGNAEFILTKLKTQDGGLNHCYKNGNSFVNGYLEDYCFSIEGFIALYQATFDKKWLLEANQMADYTVKHFYDKNSGMFFFTSDLDKELITRKMEVTDNVIPSSNSAMAKNLFLLSHYFDNAEYKKISEQMLNNVKEAIKSGGSWHSNWGLLLLNNVYPFNEFVIVGKDAEKKKQELNTYYLPNKLLAGSMKETDYSPLLKDRFVNGRTLIYVCENRHCKLPVESVEEAIKQIK